MMQKQKGILVGFDDKGRGISLPSKVRNPSALFTGTTGAGKSTLIFQTAGELVRNGDTVFILDASNSFLPSQLHPSLLKEYKDFLVRYDIKQDGVPMSLWPIHQSGIEQRDDDVDAVMDILTTAASFGSRQTDKLRSGVDDAYPHRFKNSNQLGFLAECISQRLSENDSAAIIGKLHYLLRRTVTSPHLTLKTGRINVLDANGFSSSAQPQVMDLLLGMLWQNCQTAVIEPDRTIYILLDELHRLSFNLRKSPLAQILREGRKYHVGVLASTQTLLTFTKEQNALLNQAATKFYGVQTSEEAWNIANRLDPRLDRNIMARQLMSLHRGQFLMLGTKFVGNTLTEDPIIINNDLSNYICKEV